MSERHQTNRRRTYARRQHQILEAGDRNLQGREQTLVGRLYLTAIALTGDRRGIESAAGGAN